MNDPYHAPPADVLGLAQTPIAEPDNFLEVVEKLLSLAGLVLFAEQSDFVFGVFEVEGDSGGEGQLEDAVVFEVVC